MYVCMYIWVTVEWVSYFYAVIYGKISQFQSIGIARNFPQYYGLQYFL